MSEDSTITPAVLIHEAERCVTLSREALAAQHKAYMEAQEAPYAGGGEHFVAGTRKAGEDLRRAIAVLEAMQAMREACAAQLDAWADDPVGKHPEAARALSEAADALRNGEEG